MQPTRFHWWTISFLFLGCLLGSLFTGCTTSESKPTATAEQPEVIRSKTWWNFYERGRHYLHAGELELARDDFLRCLGELSGARTAYPEPGWRVRTYGMHFIENYFPQRELGICYFLLGDAAAAKNRLEASLSHLSSDRARYYLKKTNQQSATTPGGALEVSWQGLVDNAYMNDREVQVQGDVRSPYPLESLAINAQPECIDYQAVQQRFQRRVALKPGKNTLSVTAQDCAGRKVSRVRTVIADWQAPQIFIHDLKDQQGTLEIHLTCLDHHGLSQVLVDGAPVPELGALQYPERLTVHLNLPPGRPGLLEAQDRAGNRYVTDLRATGRTLLAVRQASTWQVAQVGGSVALGDSHPPRIDLKGLSLRTVVYQDHLFLDAAVHDAQGLADIRLGGDSRLPAKEPVTRSALVQEYIPLQVGTNRIEISAVDRAGNRAQKTLQVVRRVPEYLWLKHRMRAGVAPVLTPEKNWEGEQIRALMQHVMGQKPPPLEPRFFLQPTDRAMWEHLLRERRLSLSELAHEQGRLNFEEIGTPDVVLKSHLFRDRGGITLLVKMVDAVSGKELAQEDLYHEEQNGILEELVAGLVSKVERRFPLAQGKIISTSRNELQMDIGREEGLMPGLRFLVIQPAGTSLSDGLLRKSEGQCVELMVESAGRRVSRARLTTGGKGAIHSGDFVYAR